MNNKEMPEVFKKRNQELINSYSLSTDPLERQFLVGHIAGIIYCYDALSKPENLACLPEVRALIEALKNLELKFKKESRTRQAGPDGEPLWDSDEEFNSWYYVECKQYLETLEALKPFEGVE